MRRFRLALSLLAFAVAAAGRAQTAEEIMDASIRASGGYDAFSRVKTLRREGTATLGYTGQALTAEVKQTILPWQAYHEIFEPRAPMVERGWDGAAAWEDGPQGLRDLNPEEAALLRFQSALHPFIGRQMLAITGAKIERLEDEKLGERDCRRVQITFDKETKLRFHVDKATELVARMTVSRHDPALGVTINANFDFDGYAEFCEAKACEPIKLPTKLKFSLGTIQMYEVEWRKTEVNGEVDPALFAKPANPKPGATKAP